MSREELAFWVAIVANGVTFVQIMPQIVRLLRTGHTEGVSPVWAAVGMTINVGWLTYVVENEFWETIPSIIAAISSFGLALFLLYRNGVSVRAALLMSAVVAVGSVGDPAGCGLDGAGHGAGSVQRAVSRTCVDRGVARVRPGRSVARHLVADRVGGLQVGPLRRTGGRGADHGVRVDRDAAGGWGSAAAVDDPRPHPG